MLLKAEGEPVRTWTKARTNFNSKQLELVWAGDCICMGESPCAPCTVSCMLTILAQQPLWEVRGRRRAELEVTTTLCTLLKGDPHGLE